MRLQGSKTRSGPVGLGGDFSRVKRESAGYGRKRKGSRSGGREAAAAVSGTGTGGRREVRAGQGKGELPGRSCARVQRGRASEERVRACVQLWVEDGGGGDGCG